MKDVNKKRLKELQEEIILKIKPSCDTKTQALKLVSEVSKIFNAYTISYLDEKGNINKKVDELLKESLGGVLYTLIQLAELVKKEAEKKDIEIGTADLRWCNAEKVVNDEDDTAMYELITVVGKLSYYIRKGNPTKAITNINTILKYINYIASLDEFSLDECLEFYINKKDKRNEK